LEKYNVFNSFRLDREKFDQGGDSDEQERDIKKIRSWVTGKDSGLFFSNEAGSSAYSSEDCQCLAQSGSRNHPLMWRRIHVIEFPRKFSESEMDVELTGKLMDELSGIFNWALEGYRRLRDQEFIFSKSPSMQKTKKLYKQKNSNVIDFIESRFVEILAVNQSFPFKDMYEQYRSFCLREGITQISSKKDFRSMIESEGFPIENSSKHANQLRIFEPRIAELN